MTLSELKSLREKIEISKKLIKQRIYICTTGCRASGALELVAGFNEYIEKNNLAGILEIVESGCHGKCSQAPLIRLEPSGYYYGKVKPEDVSEIVEKTILGNEKIERFYTVTSQEGEKGFFGHQKKDILLNCGIIDPKKIDDAIGVGAYMQAAAALESMSPLQVIENVLESGLKGRGGAGFPTGLKWKFCHNAPGDEKYLICNADEGDPGAFMDRALLEGSPHQIIEGMIIAAYAIGASRGFIYVRAEYPIAVEHITLAVKQAEEYGLLGDNILGSGFNFRITIRKGAGAFVCGEETALIASLEGKRGMPRSRPPFPANSGYMGKPTNINNVETLANIPLIIEKTGKTYSETGTKDSKGTKIFALAGDVKNTGLVEVPMGISLREIIYDIGEGIPDGRNFKAAQMGGPSGGCVPGEYLDLPIDYESLKEVGAIMGSGGLIVMDDRSCMVDMAHYFLEFIQKESCGKCVPCRVGTRHMKDILARICGGKGEKGDIEKLEELAVTVKSSSLCALGQTAPNPVLTTLKYFRNEYEAHIFDKKCPAGNCRDLLTYEILEENCTGCGVCKKNCPVSAISGEKKEIHSINPNTCTECGKCFEVCKFQAVRVS
ncbi:MAG: NADH-quinone oxidoreductase subunit NuoF [Spirochaetaceae bacterium]|nr:NADH-quinone oxidoreductase subunit NuoF [Spirochaetaceae bacterium]